MTDVRANGDLGNRLEKPRQSNRPRLPTVVITNVKSGDDHQPVGGGDSGIHASSIRLMKSNELDDPPTPYIGMRGAEDMHLPLGPYESQEKDISIRNNPVEINHRPAVKQRRKSGARLKTQIDNQEKLSNKKTIERMYESKIFVTIFGSVIFLSLFLRDLWIISSANVMTDIYCDILILCILLFFVIESIINSIEFKKYRFSFVFLLDTLSTLTLVFDTTTAIKALDTANSDFIGGPVVRIMKLFTVLKLWRASRLYFRKNQIAVCKPITVDTLDPLVGDYQKKHKRNANRLDVADESLDDSEEEVQGFADAVKDRRDLQKKLVSKRTIRLAPEESALGSPETSMKGFKFDQVSLDKQENQSRIKATNFGQDGTFGADNGSRQLLPSKGKSPNSQVLAESTEDMEKKHGALLVKIFNKDARRYMNQSFTAFRDVSDSIAEYKIQQSGNISKTLSYTNVRNLACFLLLSNLGLSLFLSSIFQVDPQICIVDKSAIKVYVEESNGQNLTPLVEFMKVKYDSMSTNMIYMGVGDYFTYSEGDSVNTLRITEEIICMDKVTVQPKDGPKREIEISIYLKNRQYMVLNSMMNILRNIVIILILIFNIYGVNKDTRTLILNPLDSLFENVGVFNQVVVSHYGAFPSNGTPDQERY